MFKFEDVFASESSIDDFYTTNSARKNTKQKIRVASISDLNGFVKIAKDKLVRVSNKDFWRLAQDSETGEYVIERIEDDLDGPVQG